MFDKRAVKRAQTVIRTDVLSCAYVKSDTVIIKIENESAVYFQAGVIRLCTTCYSLCEFLCAFFQKFYLLFYLSDVNVAVFVKATECEFEGLRVV